MKLRTWHATPNISATHIRNEAESCDLSYSLAYSSSESSVSDLALGTRRGIHRSMPPIIAGICKCSIILTSRVFLAQVPVRKQTDQPNMQVEECLDPWVRLDS
jgi:hypothetical protein